MNFETLKAEKWASADRLVPAAVMAMIAYAVLIFYLFVYPGLVTVAGGSIVINDFLSFWVAAREAVSGDPATAYRTADFAAIQYDILGRESFFAFFYPPTYLLMLLPLGLLSGVSAFFVFQALSLGGASWASARITGHWHGALLAAALPTTFNAIFHGQNGLLTTALLGAGLYCLSRDRWFLAGVFIGFMTFKPQMGLLIPFALLAGGNWRCFAVAALTTILFAGASFLAFGADTWAAFLEQSAFARQTLNDGLVDLHKFVSVYGAGRLLGAGPAVAYGVQGLVSLCALALVVKTWRSGKAFEAKAMVLVGAGLLATPFVLSYDMAVVLVPLAYLLRLHQAGRGRPWDMTLALVMILIASGSRLAGEAMSLPLGPLAGMIIVFLGLRHRPERP